MQCKDRKTSFYETNWDKKHIKNQLVANLLPLIEGDVRGQRMSAYIGAQKLLDAYFNVLKR